MKQKYVVKDKKCPVCEASWVGEPIPEAIRHEYGNLTHFTKVIFHIDSKNQRITGYECPNCEESFRK